MGREGKNTDLSKLGVSLELADAFIILCMLVFLVKKSSNINVTVKLPVHPVLKSYQYVKREFEGECVV